MDTNYPSLATISSEGKVPKTRMEGADQVIDYVSRLLDRDTKRSLKRTRVNGLVDGNPPYSRGKLISAGRPEACNVNWGTGRSYLESGAGAFYDLYCEAPGFVGIKVNWGQDDDAKEQYGRIMSGEADRIFATDQTWDWNIQQSIWDMVLHNCGPLLFEDEDSALPRAFHSADLLVPERTKSDTTYWESAVILAEYYPPELFAFISGNGASERGWNVEYTRKVIMSACSENQGDSRRQNWEWYQQELKNNSLTYVDDTLICRLAHVFWKEFDGSITHVIVDRENTARNSGNINDTGTQSEFLFRSIGRYDSWQQVIHPMYFDRGNGGFHHSVTGLGVKMQAAMEYQNRLLCNLMDKAFAPKILFKPTTAEASQKLSLQHMGDYGVLSANFEAVQNPIAGLLTDGLAIYRATSDLMQSNLSAYRQQVPVKQEGNPITAKQVMLEASQQSALSKTTFNRYYRQLDLLYTEIVRRLCKRNSTDVRAKEFQKRCLAAGMPEQCFKNVERVEAMRIIGQGTAFTRKVAVDSLMPFAGSLNESGRNALINDKIAAEAGQSAVSRYNPNMKAALPTEQQAEAIQWVAAMKVGVPPVVTPGQNPVTYASTFLAAATQSLQSLQQGSDPVTVLAFLDIAGPAIAAQLQRMAQDPTRQEVFKALSEQWKQLAKLTDQLRARVDEQMQQNKDQTEKTQEALTDSQLKQLKTVSSIKMSQQKTAAKLSADKAKLAQQLAIADAQAGSAIHRENVMASNEISMRKRESEAASTESE